MLFCTFHSMVRLGKLINRVPDEVQLIVIVFSAGAGNQSTNAQYTYIQGRTLNVLDQVISVSP
ncbi:TPA: hypothetical protein DCZ31_03865 [Patescibacteria group bacterium]|nr:hypothetical protein [Candidatus Gracilibacteria bacterium]